MIILENATIVTSEKEASGTVVIENGVISDVLYSGSEDYQYLLFKYKQQAEEVMDLSGKHLIAGGIDAHVHFREPGLTHKADMQTESEAAIKGGVTSFIDMPNTNPATTSAQALKDKIGLSKDRVRGKIAFHIGVTNDNADEVCQIIESGDPQSGISSENIAGVKVFMGSSTGNMLVDTESTLEKIFAITEKPVLVHCEDEATIKNNLEEAVNRYGDNIPFSEHEHIRSRKACIKSSIKALEMAIRHGTALVLCHISTKEELEMVRAAKNLNPKIIAETSCNYLWFSNSDYDRLGSKAKCNPSLKTADDRAALREGLANGTIDTIGSDHAPHLLSEKDMPYLKAPSGLPTIQQSLPALLTIAHQENIPLTRIAAVFSENASELYRLRRGKIAKGYDADIVIFDLNKEFTVRNEDQMSKCGWTPYEGETLRGVIESVFVDGIRIL